jgi:hypothetical protein
MISAIGAFFASFQPKDWVTAVLAVGAIVLSIVTVVQNARHHPRARLKYKWDRTKATDRNFVMMAELTISNEGTASAMGLRLDIDIATPRDAPHWLEEKEFVQGRVETILVPLMPSVRSVSGYGETLYEIKEGALKWISQRSMVTVNVAGHRVKHLRAPIFRRWWKKEVAEQERQIEALKNG